MGNIQYFVVKTNPLAYYYYFVVLYVLDIYIPLLNVNLLFKTSTIKFTEKKKSHLLIYVYIYPIQVNRPYYLIPFSITFLFYKKQDGYINKV